MMKYPDAIAMIAKEIEGDEARMEYGEAAAQMSFAIALTFARQERGMSQEELADLLGVSKAYVVRLESGEANPSIAKAGRIFAALWLTPIDKPYPLLKGYGPYEQPRDNPAEKADPEPATEMTTRQSKR
jgi:transcriptional regulator with XRE-family HTH domain